MLTRTISGAVFIALIVGSAVYSGWTFALLFLIFTMIGLLELFKLNKGSSSQVITGTFFGILVYCLIYFYSIGEIEVKTFASLIPPLALIYLIELFRNKENTFENIATTLWGSIYIALPFGLLNVIAMWNGVYDYTLPIGILLIIWSSDTFAYLSGSFLGKHKLFEKISPKKSWEGYFGGLVFALITGYLNSILFDSYELRDWLVIGAMVGTVGALGDLIESKIKRNAKVKDSGNIMPGHGGILDRFDSLLFIIPLVFFYLIYFVQ